MLSKVNDIETANQFIYSMNSTPVPSPEYVSKIIHQAKRALFPDYQIPKKLDPLEYHLAEVTRELFDNLSYQIALAIQHDCLHSGHLCSKCSERSRDKAFLFIDSLRESRALLAKDINACLDGDPAAKSWKEVLLCYPGFLAITVYRMAHSLYELDVPILPRMMTEHAHSLTGIDIHPGAKIGESFFIDHGTGVVVGETTLIGNRVRLYQGVTLGALSVPKDAVLGLRDKKRHPTIEDDVIIYSNATILGGETVIGARSIIGGNVWITESVPSDTKVVLKRPELDFTGNSSNPETQQ